MDRRLVQVDGGVYIHYGCNEGCWGQEFIAPVDLLGKSYACPRCSYRINTLPVRCFYKSECRGRYQWCPGTILLVSAEELAANRQKAWEAVDFDFAGAAPTDDFHDDVGAARREAAQNTTASRCNKCGEEHNAEFYVPTQGVACRRIVCDTCSRFPSARELPTLARKLEQIGSRPIN